ncbi:hypothetical protein ACE1CI_03345 [Aerosakkonemataceae cyanobacterium BLCC-F50]|uniref:Uncharacterized protein n=1 Tax=Floridaenema flaviceps BLCC-F50 TaxID=3153642 RepID=A0ABV4XLI3_9CYAN
MSKTVIISGSRSIKELPALSIASINRIIELGFNVIVGDAPGVDSLVLNYLKSLNYHSVKVYYALFAGNGKPRNTAGYACVGVSGNYRDRDKFMCSIADYGLAIWDGKSIGTAENISRVQKTRVIYAQSEAMHKYSCMSDGIEQYCNPEHGWDYYRCEIPICKDGTPIQINQRYLTDEGEVLVLDKKLKQHGNVFCWLYDVQDEDGDRCEFLPYQFKKPV